MKVIEVTQDNFNNEVLEYKSKVLLDFNAAWCGPCQSLKPIFEEVAMNNSDIKFVSINVDDAPQIAKNYKIFSIPCLILLENGKEIKRNVGLLSKDDLEKFLQ